MHVFRTADQSSDSRVCVATGLTTNLLITYVGKQTATKWCGGTVPVAVRPYVNMILNLTSG